MYSDLDSPTLQAVFNGDQKLNWQERRKVRNAFSDLVTNVRTIGISEIYYSSRLAGEYKAHRLTVWNPRMRQEYDRANYIVLMNAMGANQGSYTRIDWHRPEIVPTRQYKAFYDFLENYGRFGETSYWLKDSPHSATVISFCIPNCELSPDLFYKALAPSLLFQQRFKAIIGQANRRRIGLSEVEETHLKLLTEGCGHKEIAETMSISKNWAAKTCMRVRKKLGVKSDLSAVARAKDLRIFD